MVLQISIASKTKKHDPTYYLTVTTTPSKGQNSITQQLQTSFTTWFTADGYFVTKPFQQWLASGVDAIGDADLKNKGREERDGLAGTIPVDASVEANGTLGASGIDDKGKGSKRSKKKG